MAITLDADDPWLTSFPSDPGPYRGPGPERDPIVPRIMKDHDGRDVALVPVHHKRTTVHAKLFPEDWERLMKAGVPDWWRLLVQRPNPTTVYAYVAVYFGPPHYTTRQVARLLTNPDPSYCVKYWDRNPLNLRLDNLRVTDARR